MSAKLPPSIDGRLKLREGWTTNLSARSISMVWISQARVLGCKDLSRTPLRESTMHPAPRPTRADGS
eukprot:8701386-Pyramimonas_sp.AAC.1